MSIDIFEGKKAKRVADALESISGNLANLIAPDVAQETAVIAEAKRWVDGKNLAGNPVPSTAPQFENNAKYYAEQTEAAKTTAVQAIEAKGEQVLHSIPSEYTELSGDVDDLKSAITEITGNGLISFTTKKYIDLSGQTANISSMQTPSGDCNCAVVACTEGDTFIIYAKGGNRARAWAFVNNNNNGEILRVKNASQDANGEIQEAPQNTTHLVINDNSAPPSKSFWGSELLTDRVAELSNEIVDIENKAVISKNVLNSSNDLNNLTTPGIYSTSSSSLPQNVPENDGGCVIVFAYNGYIKQEYITKQAFYERCIIGATINPWSKQIVTNGKGTALGSSADIDNILDNGVYFWTTGSAPANVPVSGKYGVLLSLYGRDDMHSHIVIGEFEICHRVRLSSGWTDWIISKTEVNDTSQRFVNSAFRSILDIDIISLSNPRRRNYYDLTVATPVDLDNPSISSGDMMCGYLECNPGDAFVITGRGGGSARLYGFLDENNIVLSTAASNAKYTNQYVVAPPAAKYIVVNTTEQGVCWRDNNASCVVDVDFSKIMKYTGAAQPASGYCVWGSTGLSADLLIKNAQQVYVKANSDRTARVVFMKTQGVPYYFTDQTKRIDTSDSSPTLRTVNAGQDFWFAVPSDANYLNVMLLGADGLSYKPEQVIIVFKNHGEKDYYEFVQGEYPKNLYDDVMYRKVLQMRDIEWDALGDIYSNTGRVQASAGQHVMTGIPYSSVKEKDKYVGFNVTYKTFMTAAHNPYSLLYTEKCSDAGGTPAHSGYGISYNGTNTGCYFGQVCNVFVENCLGMRIPYNSDEYAYLCKIGVVDKIADQSASGVVPGDICWVPHHCYIVTNVKHNADGSLLYIEISEARLGWSSTRRMTGEDFEYTLMVNGGGIIYRYNERYKNTDYRPLPFIPLWDENQDQQYVYNDDICTYAGDYACFYGGHGQINNQEPIFINCNLGSAVYNELVIAKVDFVKWKPVNTDDWYPSESDFITQIATYNLSTMGNLHEIMINGTVVRDGSGGIVSTSVTNPLEPGKYIAYLTGNGAQSEPTHFEIVDTSVSITKTEDDAYKIEFSSQNGRPQYIQNVNAVGASLGIHALTDEEVASGIYLMHPKKMYDEQYAINYYGAHDGDVVPSGKTYGTYITDFPKENGNLDYTVVYCKVFFVGEYGIVRNDIIPYES